MRGVLNELEDFASFNRMGTTNLLMNFDFDE